VGPKTGVRDVRRGTRGTAPGRILMNRGRVPGFMAPGRFTAWSIRWLPHVAAAGAAAQLAHLLADAFDWNVEPVVLLSGGVLVALFASISALGFWSRGLGAGRESPVLA
jgi:hypothetical protein